MNGAELLAEFRKNGSDAAFAELVRGYTNLVYSAAKRRLSNDALAQEVTQLVFIRLAKAAPNLRTDAELIGWLHRTATHVSIDLWRADTRRRAREESAASMQADSTDQPAWNDVAPAVDEALNTLNDADRQTLLLRFFHQKTMREVGTAFGISEDAAKMRVSRALERLCDKLSARGITATAVVLGGMLAEQAVESAPAQLVKTLAAFKFSTAQAGASGLLHLSKLKLLTVGASAVVVVGALLLSFRSPETSQRSQARAPQLTVPQAQPKQVDSASNQNAAVVAGESEPDPIKLLEDIRAARQRITSGLTELEVYTLINEHERTETNHVVLKTTFDGRKRRVDSVGREYAYVSTSDEGAASDEAKIVEAGLDREGAVQAGLLEGFEAHVVTAHDGEALLRYREKDGKPESVIIDDATKGSYTFAFDPRILGISTTIFDLEDVNSCLSPGSNVVVRLVGKEPVEGILAWHVRIGRSEATALQHDLWIDTFNPLHVVKCAFNGEAVSSKYDDANPLDPIPIETRTSSHSGRLRETRVVRRSAKYNIPVDATFCTLAGLGLKVGTSVVDVRISRRIGYWTGSGLSENLPRKGQQKESAPDRAELMALLENEPGGEAALKGAIWILLNTPDGPEVEKAADVIMRFHVAGSEMKQLAEELERMRHRCSKNLLAAMVEQNPDPEVRALACFNLAALFKREAAYGKNAKATAEADHLFSRFINEFSPAGARSDLADRAKAELNEIRNLYLGKTAPPTEGKDLNGQSLRLSDYRDRIVVLFFWSGSTLSDLAEHQKCVRQLADKPVAFIGIYRDRDLQKARGAVEKNQVTWPSFHDGPEGPIYTAWNIHSWPTIIILDRKGIIRYRDLRSWDIPKAVDALLKESDKAAMAK